MNHVRNPLEQECRIFTRFLLGSEADTHLVARYVEAHSVLSELTEQGPFDRLLLRVGRRHPVLANITSSYARIFAPRSTLQKKLVLLLAIVETRPPFYHLIDRVDPASLTRHAARTAGWVTRAVLCLAVGTLMLLPAQLGLRLFNTRR